MSSERSYVIAMPVPNITGELHTGHALNLVWQDAIARHIRGQGHTVSFRPGVDHAGVNGQLAAERALAASGTDRGRLGRSEFGAYMRIWHDEHQQRLLGTMRQLAISADWDEAVSSVDRERIRRVQSAFAALVEDGIVYRDFCLVSWCTRCSTCIPNEEVSRREVTHTAYHLRLGTHGQADHVLITLDPVLMHAATGVRLPPSYDASAAGAQVRLPGVDRVVRVERSSVARERALGSGLSLVLPSYNSDDFEAARARGEAVRPLFNPDGTLCLPGDASDGLAPEQARARLVAELERRGDIVCTEPYLHGEAYHELCGGPVLPRPTMQWLIRLDSLAQTALQLITRPPTRFNAPMWKERADKVMTEVQQGGEPRNPWWEGACLAFVRGFTSSRDWMISRQNWWGIPIPVLECISCGSWRVSLQTEAAECHVCGSLMLATQDVFDVLFHSALWALCVTPDPDADYHANLAVVGHDILEFWIPVANLLTEALFRKPSIEAVLVHGLICDEDGRKMSKSLGNAVSLGELLETYGTEAVRSLVLGLRDAATTEMVPLRQADIESATAFVEHLQAWIQQVSIGEAPDPLLETTLDRAREELGMLMSELDVSGAYAVVQDALRVVMKRTEVSPAALSLLGELLAPFHPLLGVTLDERRAGPGAPQALSRQSRTGS